MKLTMFFFLSALSTPSNEQTNNLNAHEGFSDGRDIRRTCSSVHYTSRTPLSELSASQLNTRVTENGVVPGNY